MDQSDVYLLQHVPPYHVQAILRARHVTDLLKGQISTELSPARVAELAEYLFDPLTCREVIEGLNEVEKLILGELVACGGRANSRDLALYLSSSGLLQAAKSKRDTKPLAEKAPARAPAENANASALQYPQPHPHGTFEQALHGLLVHGLLFWGRQTNFSGRDYASGVYDGVLIVPQAVMEVAREALAPVRTAQKTVSEDEILTHHLEGLRALQRSLYLYWSLVASQRYGLSLVSSRLLARASLRLVLDLPGLAAAPVTSEADAPYLLFLRLLLMKLGLLQERGNTVVAAPAESFFSLPLLERARRCFHLWLETPFWNELNYIPGVIVRPAFSPVEPAHEEVVKARRVVLNRLLGLPSADWQFLPAFIARTKLYAPQLLFPRDYGARAERYSIGSNPYNRDFRLRLGWLTHREGWYLVEGGFIRSLITNCLNWLGVVELQKDNDTFRVIPQLPFLLEDAPLERDEPGKLIVQPNFELIALAPVSEGLLVQLDRFAERVRLEQIAQYKLTKNSVTRAIQTGMRTDDIRHLLEQAAGGSIPQNVSYSLAEWERQARRVEIWTHATVLEVHDEQLLDELFNSEELRPLLRRRLSPYMAEVAPGGLEQVQEILWERDILPALTSASQHANLLESGRFPTREAQWQLLDDGKLRPCHPVLNLYLASELERFTEFDEESGWRKITPHSIERASEQHIPLDAIVRFLQHYCEGGIPASFLIRLKLWGGGYEQQDAIAVERAPLLRLSAQALRDIQADEELGMLLGAEIPAESRLVRVAPDMLDRVIELLKERGFSVE